MAYVCYHEQEEAPVVDVVRRDMVHRQKQMPHCHEAKVPYARRKSNWIAAKPAEAAAVTGNMVVALLADTEQTGRMWRTMRVTRVPYAWDRGTRRYH